ncbi:hypothetical protein ACFW6E_43955 [Streptomyces olivaceoviridis]|uniref:hypothetical protein n=1 Tax=Streptomyces olivaceoviridis TaxID=1921 RepID=UPI0036C350BF
MSDAEPHFEALEYVTITKDARTGLVVALSGTEQAAGLLQRAGFLDHPGPRGTYHRLPHGLPAAEQRRKATAASHALLSAGYSVHLDPALNALAVPDGDRDAALRYLVQLPQQATAVSSGNERAALLTEIAGPSEGFLPLIGKAVAVACVWSLRPDAGRTGGATLEPAAQLGSTADALSRAADQILRVRNDIARAHSRPTAGGRAPSPAPRPTPAAVSHSR